MVEQTFFRPLEVKLRTCTFEYKYSGGPEPSTSKGIRHEIPLLYRLRVHLDRLRWGTSVRSSRGR